MIPYLCLVAAGLALLAALGLARAAEPGRQPRLATPITASVIQGLDRADLQRMLARLEKAPVPEPKPSAMCYMPLAPRVKAEYVCPTCGAKTIYALDARHGDFVVNNIVSHELDYARRAAQQIRTNTLAVTLVETSFCRQCSPDVKKPSLALRVVFADRSERLVPDVKPADIGLLRDFLAGRTTLSDGAESPLKDNLPRLRELLGFAPPATTVPAAKP